MGLARSSVVAGARTEGTTLRISPNGKYLVDQNGTPFLCCGDAWWTPEVNLTAAQIDQYLDARIAQGFNSVMLELIEALYCASPPANVNGDGPFSTPGDFSTPKPAYWQFVDNIVTACRKRNVVVWGFPAYLGFNGGNQGWDSVLVADTQAHRQSFGKFLGNRWPVGWVNWILGGDYPGDDGSRDKQYDIITGLQTVRASGDLVSAHNSRTNGEGYVTWGGGSYPAFNVNSIYLPTTGEADALAATAVTRGMPILMLEDGYEAGSGIALTNVRRSVWTALLSGATGHFSCHDKMWDFGSGTGDGDGLGAAHAIATYMSTTGTTQRLLAFSTLKSYKWWLGVPTLDSSLISTALGTSGTSSRTCPFFIGNNAAGRDAALVYKNNTSSITLVRSKFQQASINVAWLDPTSGVTSAPAEGSTFSNSGSQAFAHPGNNGGGDTDWVLACS